MKKTKLIALMLCAFMLISVALTGCSSKNVLKVDGENIPEGYYNYYYGYLYSYMGYYVEYDDELLDQYAISQIKQQQAVKKLAKDLKIELTALENKSVIDSINSSAEQMGQTAYASFLNALNLSNKQYQDINKNYVLYNKLYNYFYNPETGVESPSDEVLLEDYEANYTHATHIFLSTQEAESEAEREEIYKKAEEILAKVHAGEDFYDLIREYGEDVGVAETPEIGYYFNDKTGYDPTFTAAAYELEENEVSEIVTSSLGYHIILRLPFDAEYVQTLIDAEDSTIYAEYCSRVFAEKINAIASEMTVEKLDAFNSIDVSTAVAAWMSQGQ